MSEIGESLKSKKVLVTGATGFVGSWLVKKLLSVKSDVSILVRKGRKEEITNQLRELGSNVIEGDVTDRESVFKAVDSNEIVFHIAALFREAKHDDSMYYKVNVEGVRNVLDASKEKGVKRVIHCSTVGVHSHIINPPANEEEDYRPGDIYQETKCEGEKLARSYFESSEVPGVIIRPAMIWGEGDKRLLKLFKGVSKRRFPIIGTGKVKTHWIYVHDLVNAFLLAAEKDEALGNIYIIAGRRDATIEELVNAVSEVAKVKPLPFKIPAKPVQIAGSICEAICKPFGIEPPLYRRRVDFFTKDRSFDTSKAVRDLGFSPKGDFKDEVKAIYSWYKENNWL